MNLSGKVALIVGGRRMGLGVAEALAAKGVDVAISYRGAPDSAEEAAARIRAMGRRAMTVFCDVTQDESVPAMMSAVNRELGGPDVLVAMASHYEQVPFEELDSWAMERQLGVDMRGTFLCMRAVLPFMRAAGGGRIITFSDWLPASGRPRYKGFTNYYVGKAGVKALTEAFALELSSENILVNSIAPGPILPPADYTDDVTQRVASATPLGRWGGVEPIAHAVVALAENDYTTGETIRVDGGRHLS